MIAICPPQMAPMFQAPIVPLKDIIRAARSAGKKPSQKVSPEITTANRREYFRLYYLANKERKKAQSREYAETHKEQVREYHRRYYQKKKVVI